MSSFRSHDSCTKQPHKHVSLTCHSLSLASVKSRLVLPFWYRLTRVVPDKIYEFSNFNENPPITFSVVLLTNQPIEGHTNVQKGSKHYPPTRPTHITEVSSYRLCFCQSAYIVRLYNLSAFIIITFIYHTRTDHKIQKLNSVK